MKKLVILCLCLVFWGLGCTKKESTAEKNVIKFCSWGSQSETAILKRLLSDFESQNPDLKVEFIHIPQNYFQKLHLLFASNLAPDVIFINNLYSPIYIKAGLLEDLTPYFDQEINNNTFYKNALKSFTYENKLYALPRDFSYMVIYYNKDIFDKTKTKYPDRNWTLADFLKIAQKTTTKDNWAINFEPDSLYWLNYLRYNGGGILTDNSDKIIIDSKESIDGIQFYSDLIYKYKVMPEKYQIANRTGAQMFIQQRLSMYLGGRWMAPKFLEVIDFNWDVINFPASNKYPALTSSSGWAMSKNSKNKENSIKLIKFLSSEESIKKLSKTGLIIPARKDVATSSQFIEQFLIPQNSKIFIEFLDNSHPIPSNENYQQINDILNEAIEPVFNGNKNAKDAITPQLIDKLNKLL